MNELVSIVVPVYNAEDTLDRCILSLLKQTYRPIEILLIDDGSTDKSDIICDQYAGKYAEVRTFHTVNCGVSHARNIGIKNAKGEYLTFVDSDDYVDEVMVSSLVDDLVKCRSDISISSLEKTNSDNFCIALDKEHENEILFLSQKHLIFGPTQKLYKTSIAKGLLFPENRQYGEDLLFNLNYLEKTRTISFINECFYHYCRREVSLSTKTRWDMFENDMHLHKMLLEWYETMGFLSDDIKSFVYNRILDTAVNSMCLYFRKDCLLSRRETEEQIRRIVINKLVQNCFQYADTSKYAKWQTTMIKHQRSFILSCIAMAKRVI